MSNFFFLIRKIKSSTCFNYYTLYKDQQRQYNKLTLEDKTANNYLVVEKNRMSFVLNEYKTNKKYHEKYY